MSRVFTQSGGARNLSPSPIDYEHGPVLLINDVHVEKERLNMRDGFKVIDADRHVLEPSDLFANYLPATFRDRVRIEGPNQSFRFVDDEPISDADKLRPVKKQEDYGFTFAGSKSWRETLDRKSVV